MIPQSGLPELFPRFLPGQEKPCQLLRVFRGYNSASGEIRQRIQKRPIQGRLRELHRTHGTYHPERSGNSSVPICLQQLGRLFPDQLDLVIPRSGKRARLGTMKTW